MGQVVYRFRGSSFNFLESPFGEVLGEEICRGEIGARGDGELGDVTLERGTTLPIPILAFQSKITTTMRRTHRHVREGAKSFYLLWLIEKGQVSISCSNGSKTVPANSIMITNASNPSYIEALVDREKEHRNKLALIPAYLMRSFLPESSQLNTMSFPASSADGTVVTHLVNLLFETGDALDREDAAEILSLLLRALKRLVVLETNGEFEPRNMQQLRLSQIKAHIDLHLGNPSLSLTEVARMCGISTRYLVQVMSVSGISFATALRERRLEEACRWLSAADKASYTIGEIAKIVGYSSGAQLSRCFHTRYACTPRAFRKQSVGGQSFNAEERRL